MLLSNFKTLQIKGYGYADYVYLEKKITQKSQLNIFFLFYKKEKNYYESI